MTETRLRPQRIVVDGLATQYYEAGDPAAEPMLLLHDGAFGSESTLCWDPLVPLLADQFRLIAPDLLGFGGSAKVFFFDSDPLTQRISHIVAFCARLGLRRPLVVGASFGGGMLLRAAASSALPMRAGVSLSGPGGLYMIPERFAQLQDYDGTEPSARRIAEMMSVEVSDADAKRRMEAANIPGHWETLQAARLRNPSVPPTGDFRPAYRDALAKVTMPLLLVAGEQDPLLEPGWAGRLAGLIPGARCETVPGRHLPHLDQPERLAELIRQFAAGR